MLEDVKGGVLPPHPSEETEMKKLTSLVLGLALALFGVTANAEKPAWTAGTEFKYQVKGEESYEATYKVVEASAAAYRVEVTRTNGKNAVVTYNPDLNVVQVDDRKVEGSEGWKLFQHPMEVGKAWTSKFTYPHPSKPGVTVSADLKVKVLARESVTVPAGTFDVFRIEAKMDYRLSTGFEQRQDQMLYWSPAIGRIVKEELRDWGKKGPGTVSELTAYVGPVQKVVAGN